ncbi:YaeQ family protein [Dongshaea marina]|uniref:YaeQ family protein n=1 Tax=Dongshaea marina TaxID=2047966 RepID=UPI000D3E8050|nr:YaeQ family protein [Dongshaea marina]
MALKATIIKVQLSVSDLDRHLYQNFSLTLAQHPSETEQRLMIRLLAFALNADENLEFTRGLCVDDEPELWSKSPGGEIEKWIELGLPDEKRLKKACGRARKVRLYTYGRGAQDIWWEKNSAKLARLNNLEVFSLPSESTETMATLAQRNMDLQATIQDGQIWLSDADHNLCIEPTGLSH